MYLYHQFESMCFEFMFSIHPHPQKVLVCIIVRPNIILLITKMTTKFFYFQTTELILIEKVINMFPYLMTNTIKFKTENFYKIINILNPPNTIFQYKNANKIAILITFLGL